MDQMKYREIREVRDKFLEEQEGICPLCGEELLPEEATLDHCYDTGHVRAALHRSCNGAEGQIKRWAGRMSKGDDPLAFLKNVIEYWEKDWSHNPIHPRHGKPVRRKRRRKKK